MSVKRNRKRKVCLSKIVGLILFVVSCLLTIEVIAIDIIPSKYLLLLLFIMLFINFIIDINIFRKKIKKKVKNIMTAFAVLFIFLFSLAFTYLVKTMGFLSSIESEGYKIENYSVVVKKDSSYKKISDIDGLSVGYYSKTTGAKKANKKLANKVNVTFEEYDDSAEMVNKLLDVSTDKEESESNKMSDDLEVIVVEDSVLSIIKEESADFENDTRVIYTFKIKIKEEDNAKDVDVTSKSFNIYISGIDTFGEIASVSRSDVNMVVTVNPKTKQILLTSIPRDYYVPLHTYKSNDKLTHAGLYGVNESIKTIEDFLDIEINYYVKVNFTSVIDVVNALGGLSVYSDYDFVSEDGYKYTKGYNDVNGEEALSFARERHSFADGDRQRVKNQQAVLAALIKKASSKSILTKYTSLLDSLEGEFDTNMSTRKIKSLVKMQLNDMAKWTITSISLDGYDSHNTTYSSGSQALYVMEPNESTVAEASELIDKVMDGKKLNGSYEFTGKSNKVLKNTTSDKNNSSNTKSISATPSCSAGYTLSADKTVCTKNETVNPTKECSSGSLNGDTGMCQKTTTPISNGCSNPLYTGNECIDENGIPHPESILEDCPSGSTLKGDLCIYSDKQSPQITCPSGYELNGDICKKVFSIAPTYSCPSGYQLNGKTCQK